MPVIDTLQAWLSDAYVMEVSIAQMLEGHLKLVENNHTVNEAMPELANKIRDHLKKTKNHAKKVRWCIERLGGGISDFKSAAAFAAGTISGKSTGYPKDAVVKNTLSEYSIEHMEIAAYNALIAASEEVGDGDTVRVCEEILAEEEEMANWLFGQLPTVVEGYLRMRQWKVYL